MRNIKLTLSWNGANFSGYQYQPHAVTVQQTLNSAWHILTGETISLIGCSRLDAQVHANYYVLNFQTESVFSCEKIIRGMNGILHNQLKASICVYECEEVPADFHARFHSVGKHYQYKVWYGYKTHALLTPQCWHVRSKQEITNLNGILQQFVGKKDFSAFRASDCSSKQPVKHIYRVHVSQHPQFPQMTFIDIWGDGFLKNMIRNIVGTAIEMSIGKLPDDCIQSAFVHLNREKVGMCAPGWALTLMNVYYNKEEFLIDSKF